MRQCCFLRSHDPTPCWSRCRTRAVRRKPEKSPKSGSISDGVIFRWLARCMPARRLDLQRCGKGFTQQAFDHLGHGRRRIHKRRGLAAKERHLLKISLCGSQWRISAEAMDRATVVVCNHFSRRFVRMVAGQEVPGLCGKAVRQHAHRRTRRPVDSKQIGANGIAPVQRECAAYDWRERTTRGSAETAYRIESPPRRAQAQRPRLRLSRIRPRRAPGCAHV